MSALSHFLESEGLSTTGISLVREHTEAMAPPRSLWVPFPLGRPLGAAGDAAFQHRVIAAALALLDRPEGPVLEDFPEPAPDDGAGEPWSCPVRFLHNRRMDRTSRARPARSLPASPPGTSLRPDAVDVARPTPRGLRSNNASNSSSMRARTGHTDDVRRLKAAVEDLKTHYVEAVTARPGTPPAGAADAMLWDESALGRLLRQLAARGSESDDAAMRFLANDSLVPRRFR